MLIHSHATDHQPKHDHNSGHILLGALVFTAAFAAIEAAAGWFSNSLALIGDAAHMLTDSAALGLGALAAWLSQKPASPRHSYGLKRAEVLGALFNVLFMLIIVCWIVFEAINRILQPEPVNGGIVILIATIGLLVNIGVIRILRHGEQNMNIRGALLHVMADLLGSMAALAAGIIIWFTAWYAIDPVLSLLISVLILFSSLKLLRDVLHVLMEGVPRHLELNKVGRVMAAVDGVRAVHDLHIWSIGSGNYALSAHVQVTSLADWKTVLASINTLLDERFQLHHTTLQPEPETAQKCADDSCGPSYYSEKTR